MEENDELSRSYSVYYEVRVNGSCLGTFGHDMVRNIGVSIGFSLGVQYVFVTGVCEEAGELYMCDWIQQEIESSDKVEFRRVGAGPSLPPRRKHRMNQNRAQQSVQPDRREDAAPG